VLASGSAWRAFSAAIFIQCADQWSELSYMAFGSMGELS